MVGALSLSASELEEEEEEAVEAGEDGDEELLDEDFLPVIASQMPILTLGTVKSRSEVLILGNFFLQANMTPYFCGEFAERKRRNFIPLHIIQFNLNSSFSPTIAEYHSLLSSK